MGKLCPTDAFPRFLMRSYSVSESSSNISICIVLDMEIERAVQVELRTESVTAIGKLIEIPEAVLL